jgi:hypothetical protein
MSMACDAAAFRKLPPFRNILPTPYYAARYLPQFFLNALPVPPITTRRGRLVDISGMMAKIP